VKNKETGDRRQNTGEKQKMTFGFLLSPVFCILYSAFAVCRLPGFNVADFTPDVNPFWACSDR
jgi:hypothetical protein